MNESQKCWIRWASQGILGKLVGRGIDVGCGETPVVPPLATEVVAYDRRRNGKHNAELLKEFQDAEFDWLVASHMLEHMKNPLLAFSNWIRVVRHNGWILLSVPDWFLYEKCSWPPKFNQDHKSVWTLHRQGGKWREVPGYNLLEFVGAFPLDLYYVSVCDNGFDYARYNEDQTRGRALSHIEALLRVRR